jgi:biopolymer transport protein TolR
MPELEHGKRVALPGVSNPDPTTEPDPDDVTVTVAADDSIFIEEEEVTRAELATRLAALKKEKPKRRLMLKGDESRAYGDMRLVFKDLQAAGFTNVRLMVGTREARAARGER